MLEKKYLGDTDIASFICRSGSDAKVINTGSDGSIYAFVTDDPSYITADHQLEFECTGDLAIYDDNSHTFSSREFNPTGTYGFQRIRLFYLPEMVWEEEKHNFRMVTPPGMKERFLIVLEEPYK